MVRLIAIVLVVCALAGVSAQTDPSTLPLVQQADLVYAGGFRVPDELAFGAKQLAFNDAGPTLIVSEQGGLVAEITIPTPIKSAALGDLPVASYARPFVKLLSSNPTLGAGLSGLVVDRGRLICTVSIYYDANNDQRIGHCAFGLPLSSPTLVGWSTVGSSTQQGYIAGYLASIPAEWQSTLGGTILTGQCCIPIVTRTSRGPAAYAVDGARIGQATVPAQPLVYYDGEHQTLGPWETQNDRYGMGTLMGGVLIVPGTRSALFFGRNGMGPACYGTGTPNKALHGTDVGDGSKYCYDPTEGSKGTHAYPYRYQVWAYDLNDFASVKAGTKQPWEVVPYAVWPLEFPIMNSSALLGGVTFNPLTKQILVAQLFADSGPWGNDNRPLIQALTVASSTNIPPPPTNTTPPAPVDPRIAELQLQVAERDAKLALIKTLLQQALVQAPKNTARVVKDAIVKALALLP